MGSSPLVRGTPIVHGSVTSLMGIIPACAGNTREYATGHARAPDHPRLCGEHVVRLPDKDDKEGSSPLVRGTPQIEAAYSSGAGIIPACAGNTYGKVGLGYGSGDHPRLCGEHHHQPSNQNTGKGSSPLVRGTHPLGQPSRHNKGIIPACAGNTLEADQRECDLGDHPRLCGEHSIS